MSIEKNEMFNEEKILEMSKEEFIKLVIYHYGEGIKRLIFTYVKDFNTTDDIFQEVLIAIYKNIDQFKFDSKLKTWIITITTNKCKDYVKSWYLRSVKISESFYNIKSKSTPEEIILKNEKDRAIGDKILSLKIKYREIIILHYYQGLKLSEISEILNVNPVTVRTRLNRAKEKLKEMMEGEWDNNE